ncbi:HAD-IB family phosphatase [Candidatus Dependentiae bacterium]|nr:HAD-IB family phosphatase [Candidatus Dependentiae bacterium]
MDFLKKKIISIFLLSFLFPFISAKKSRIKKVRENNSITKDINSDNNKSDNNKKEEENISKREDKDFKYVVFDVSNCFWQKSLYDLLMSFKKRIKIPFRGYLDLLQCGVSYTFGTLDAKKGYETFFKYYKNKKESEVKEKCKLVWENDCKNYIYKDAYERLQRHKKDGLKTIMVDAGISQLYDELIKNYKFDYAFTSSLEFKNGMSTGKLKGEPCSGKQKYKLVKKLIEEELGGSLKDVIFYANSHNDIMLLEHVGKPIAVNPNKKLQKKANKKGWPVLNFSELKKD